MPEFVPRSEFDGFVVRHEADRNAHGEARRRDRAEIEEEIDKMRSWQRAHDIAHASATGELTGVINTLRVGFGILGVLVTVFGAGILAAVLR